MSALNANRNSEQLTKDSILKIGNVISVVGRTVKVRVDKSKNVSHLLYNGNIVKNIAVGGYAKIRKGFEVLIGKIDGEYINENSNEDNQNYSDRRSRVDRVLEIRLVGFYDGQVFKKGIKELPLIDNECYLLDKEEYADVHNFVDNDDIPLSIGVLSSDRTTSISVGVNNLFASHIGIFGNTGSGKSYTLASLYHQLFNKFSTSEQFNRNARFCLLDFNGEYVANTDSSEDMVITSQEFKSVFKLSTRTNDGDKFPLTEEVINGEVLWIIAAEATEKTQAPFLRRALKNRYIDQNISTDASFKTLVIDTIFEMTKTKNKEFQSGIPNFVRDLGNAISSSGDGFNECRESITSNLGFHNGSSEFYIRTGSQTTYANEDTFRDEIENLCSSLQIYTGQLNIFCKIHAKIILTFYLEITKGFSNRDHIGPMIKRLEKRVDDLNKVIKQRDESYSEEKQLSVVSFKDVNIHMRKVLPLLICKQLYDEKRDQNDRSKYLNIIIDEAHNILSEDSNRESEQWKDYRLETFEEIIKEGRKFGTFLTIASQRPFDISPTIISQLHNYFLHRLVNEKDLKAIENTISFLDKVSFESLPILPTGSCVLSGLISQVPVVVEIGAISKESQPLSETYRPTDFWADQL